MFDYRVLLSYSTFRHIEFVPWHLLAHNFSLLMAFELIFEKRSDDGDVAEHVSNPTTLRPTEDGMNFFLNFKIFTKERSKKAFIVQT